MSLSEDEIYQVPTNIITGFLGVGKTSAILQLLKEKPSNERWAVLVNEFGEVGVDGSLIEGQYSQNQGVFIQEVPGGCMCCAAGLPMQIALNMLLARAKPDRLLIEPTGLGHPKEVLQVLNSSFNKDALLIQKTLTLVDARQLSDKRYTQHEIFNQQIAIADTVVGHKIDLYQGNERAKLRDYVKEHGDAKAQVTFAKHGCIPISLLDGATGIQLESTSHHHFSKGSKPIASQLPIPSCGYIKADNTAEGFQSIGWRFSPSWVFDHTLLMGVLTGIRAQRMKAVFITDQGIAGYNLATDVLTEVPLDDALESRIEIIAESVDDAIEAQLLKCVYTK